MSGFTKVEPGGGYGRLPPGQTRHLGSVLAICMSLKASRGERMYVQYIPPMGAMMTLASECGWAVSVLYISKS